MPIAVSTAEIKVQTVELTKAIVRQLDIRYLSHAEEAIVAVGRLDPGVLGADVAHQFSRDVVLAKVNGVYFIWANASTNLPESTFVHLPKLIVR